MAEQNQPGSAAQSHKKSRPKAKLAPVAEQTSAEIELAPLPAEPIGAEAADGRNGLAPLLWGAEGAFGGGSMETQVARLGDARLLTVQRQALAAEIGRVQGNRHLQRVVTSFGHDFGNVRVHTDSCVMQSSDVRPSANIRVSDVDGIIQRDLALEPPTSGREQPDLTDEQVQAAIRYNRASYSEESIRLIQNVVGGGVTGRFNETTIRLIARFQARFGLKKVDGKVGPKTYDLLIRELRAEAVSPTSCLTLFQIVGPQPLKFFRNSPTQGTVGSKFRIRARFDSRCNCRDFEYRQYIKGTVILRDVSGREDNLNDRFNLPAGQLKNSWQEDGDASISAKVAGHHYGHRRYAPNPSDGRDRYLPNRATGHRYEGVDIPELTPIPAAPGDSGDSYVWDMRFRGVIIRRGHGVVEEKYWAIRDTVVIP